LLLVKIKGFRAKTELIHFWPEFTLLSHVRKKLSNALEDISTIHTFSWPGASLIKHGDKFAFA
jgi:hypothetical protein